MIARASMARTRPSARRRAPVTATPPCLRVQAYPAPLGQTVSIAVALGEGQRQRGRAVGDLGPRPASAARRPGSSMCVSCRRRASRSQTAQNDWRALPTLTLATHSISSGPYTPM